MWIVREEKHLLRATGTVLTIFNAFGLARDETLDSKVDALPLELTRPGPSFLKVANC